MKDNPLKMTSKGKLYTFYHIVANLFIQNNYNSCDFNTSKNLNQANVEILKKSRRKLNSDFL